MNAFPKQTDKRKERRDKRKERRNEIIGERVGSAVYVFISSWDCTCRTSSFLYSCHNELAKLPVSEETER